MENRRLFVAVLLSLAVLILWQYLVPAKPPVPVKAPASSAAASGGSAVPIAATPDAAAPAAAPAGASSAAAGVPAAASTVPPRIGEAEERVVFEDERVRAELSSRGAQLVSFRLKAHRAADGKVLELVRERTSELYPFGLVGKDLASLPVNGALFVVEHRDREAATFFYRGPLGVCRKTFSFDANGLLKAEVTLEGAKGWGLAVGPGIRNPSGADIASSYQSRAAIWEKAGEVQTLDTRKAELRELDGGGLKWVGVEDSYYLTALVPGGDGKGQSSVATAILQPVLLETAGEARKMTRFFPQPGKDHITKEQDVLEKEFMVVVRPAGETVAVTSFWGAKEFDRLVPFGLEKAVDFGTFGVVAKPLLAGLHWIYYHVVSNYGWAIVLMTVLIKIVLLPLTHKSYVSMQKMQQLNPKQQAIRDKYRGKMKDKQGRPNLEAQRKMNEEIMGLYKAEGVNPAGGCLPMLLQLPILFAFYRMLTIAVELRNAPWTLWIHDLSIPDPIFVLPIVMAATQFLQQRMTPMTGDPAQRKMFMLMPFFMLFIFRLAPSGLVLYWLTNNVLTIIQQGVYNHLKQRQAA